LDDAAELASIALKEQSKREKEQIMAAQMKEKEAAKRLLSPVAQVNTKAPVSLDAKPRFSGMANTDADRALRLAAVEARMGIFRCVQCSNVISGPGFHQMGFRYCSTACVSLHRKSSPAPP
jgi:hypothetical protein